MFQVAITAKGIVYKYVLDSEKDVRNLVQNSYMVTKVDVWSKESKLSDSAVLKMLFNQEPAVA